MCTKSCLGCIRGIQIPCTELTAHAPSPSRGHSPRPLLCTEAGFGLVTGQGVGEAENRGSRGSALSFYPIMVHPDQRPSKASADLGHVLATCRLLAAAPHVPTQSRNPPATLCCSPPRGSGSQLRWRPPWLAPSPLCRGPMPSAAGPRGSGKPLQDPGTPMALHVAEESGSWQVSIHHITTKLLLSAEGREAGAGRWLPGKTEALVPCELQTDSEYIFSVSRSSILCGTYLH